MVAAILGCTEDPTVTFLAQSILISQQPEIQYREKLLAPPPLTPEPPRRRVWGGESSGAAQEAVAETC